MIIGEAVSRMKNSDLSGKKRATVIMGNNEKLFVHHHNNK